MKVLKKVKSIEVKRAFIVSDFISAKKDRRKHLNFVPENIFKQKLKRAHKKAMRLKESQLDKIIENEYKKRLVAYNNNNWYLGEVKTNEIGV